METQNQTLTLQDIIRLAVLTIPETVRGLDGFNWKLRGKYAVILNNPDIIKNEGISILHSGELEDIHEDGMVKLSNAPAVKLESNQILVVFGAIKYAVFGI